MSTSTLLYILSLTRFVIFFRSSYHLLNLFLCTVYWRFSFWTFKIFTMFRFDPGTAGGRGHLDCVGPAQPADHLHAPPWSASQVVQLSKLVSPDYSNLNPLISKRVWVNQSFSKFQDWFMYMLLICVWKVRALALKMPILYYPNFALFYQKI